MRYDVWRSPRYFSFTAYSITTPSDISVSWVSLVNRISLADRRHSHSLSVNKFNLIYCFLWMDHGCMVGWHSISDFERKIAFLLSHQFRLYLNFSLGGGTSDCRAFMPIPLDTFVYYCIIDSKQCIKSAGAHISYLWLMTIEWGGKKEEKSEFQPFHRAVYRNRICTATATCANSLTRVSVWIWCARLVLFGFDVWCVVLATETKFATARLVVQYGISRRHRGAPHSYEYISSMKWILFYVIR